MLKQLSAATAAFVLMTGIAVAQDQQTTTQEKTVVQNPDGTQSVQGEKTEHTMNADGSQSMAKKSFSKTDSLGGMAMSRTREEKTNAPDGSTTTTQQTTTTKSPD